MAHYYEVNDKRGDLVDVLVFCSDWCHRNYCERGEVEYGGWNGCHELEFTTPCQECGEAIPGLDRPYY